MSDKNPTTAAPSDKSQRFIFEEADIRGEYCILDTAYRDILDIHQYAPGVSRLLGELLAASVLLSTTLKFEGKLILQSRSEGQLPLLMVECNNELELRGIAQGAEDATALDNEQLLRNGQLAITIDPKEGKRYQGIVPLEHGSLAHSLDAYFEHSEQLKTRLWLTAQDGRASGLLLQQLPQQLEQDDDQRIEHWNHACTLASTLTPEELLDLPLPTLLHRLYHEEPLRLFEARDASFRCSCSRQRSLEILTSIGATELHNILTEQGLITMDCEFCNQRYEYTESDFEPVLGAQWSKTLH